MVPDRACGLRQKGDGEDSRTVRCWQRLWLPLLRSAEAGLLTLVSIQKKWPIDPPDRATELTQITLGQRRAQRRGHGLPERVYLHENFKGDQQHDGVLEKR